MGAATLFAIAVLHEFFLRRAQRTPCGCFAMPSRWPAVVVRSAPTVVSTIGFGLAVLATREAVRTGFPSAGLSLMRVVGAAAVALVVISPLLVHRQSTEIETDHSAHESLASARPGTTRRGFFQLASRAVVAGAGALLAGTVLASAAFGDDPDAPDSQDPPPNPTDVDGWLRWWGRRIQCALCYAAWMACMFDCFAPWNPPQSDCFSWCCLTHGPCFENYLCNPNPC